jgi:hypothetical protein
MELDGLDRRWRLIYPRFHGLIQKQVRLLPDVLYLDQEMLIIRQNAPGGFFISVKTDDNSP